MAWSSVRTSVDTLFSCRNKFWRAQVGGASLALGPQWAPNLKMQRDDGVLSDSKKILKKSFFIKLQIVLEYRVLGFLLESKCKSYLKSIFFQFLNILNVKNDSEKNGAMMKFDIKKLQNELIFCIFGAFCCLTRLQSGRD